MDLEQQDDVFVFTVDVEVIPVEANTDPVEPGEVEEGEAAADPGEVVDPYSSPEAWEQVYPGEERVCFESWEELYAWRGIEPPVVERTLDLTDVRESLLMIYPEKVVNQMMIPFEQMDGAYWG